MALRPGDAVLCILDPRDPRQEAGVTGIALPLKGAVYTVEAVLPKPDGSETITLCGVRSRGILPDGSTCLVGWHTVAFKKLRDVDVRTVWNKILCGEYGEMFDANAIRGYEADYREVVAEADRHRKAKW